MKRAILVSSGTVVGLVAVLSYSGADQAPAALAGGPATGAGLGAPPPDPSAPATGAPAPTAPAAAPTTAAAPTKATAPTKAAAPAPAAPTKAAAPAPAAPTTAAPAPAPAAPTKAAAPAPAPTPTKSSAAPKPKPTPTPTPTPTKPSGDFVGTLETHKYGQVQVGIRVVNGVITKAWAAVYPNGPSQPYSDFAIPQLVTETVKAQSANIASVSGATLTWQSWKTSLQAAMSKAGL